MKKSFVGFVWTLTLAAVLPSGAADQTPVAIIGSKIVVKNYQKAIDFYTRLGLKAGQKYGPTELEMLSDNPQAPRLILVHDEPGQIKATAQTFKDAGYPGMSA